MRLQAVKIENSYCNLPPKFQGKKLCEGKEPLEFIPTGGLGNATGMLTGQKHAHVVIILHTHVLQCFTAAAYKIRYICIVIIISV